MIKQSLFFQVCSGNGNSGVLLNRSDGNYGNGNEPFQWTGSLPILESFMKNNGEPVKYGQCWVVAGLVTTSRSKNYTFFQFRTFFVFAYKNDILDLKPTKLSFRQHYDVATLL